MAEFSLTTLTVEDLPEFAEADRSSATARPASCLVPCGRWCGRRARMRSVRSDRRAVVVRGRRLGLVSNGPLFGAFPVPGGIPSPTASTTLHGAAPTLSVMFRRAGETVHS